MASSICTKCYEILENDDAATNHQCSRWTDEHSDEYGYLEGNILPSAVESQVSSADAFARNHMDTRFEMRNDLFQIGKDQNETEISEEIYKNTNESIADQNVLGALRELDPIFYSNSEQQSTIEDCRSEQIISRNDHPLPSFTDSFSQVKNFYEFPTDPLNPIRNRLEDIILKDNSTRYDMLNKDSINLQTSSKASLSKNSSFEEEKLIEIDNSNSSEIEFIGSLFKCKLCWETFANRKDLDEHNFTSHKKGKISNSDMTSAVSSGKFSESRINNLDGNILPVLPNSKMGASNITRDDRLNKDSNNLQTSSKASLSKSPSFEEVKLIEIDSSDSSEDALFKCKKCSETFASYSEYFYHDFSIHKSRK
ncbi:hypothetical protein NPIL_666331 [Nephila pilipes]|uniref:C2H2-type domain-containing protein n=1 Tax=Nephila pilipes TaxID=299642 RepID=A0A8X6TYJ4_NEPPI|nr:hypothetical protein NPIL_529041 [Nephila pilipes]GFU48365.1 hypothetical protein NPIL_666331 [Nephila pilipes]